MHCAPRAFLIITCAAALYAQPAPNSNQSAGGLETPWEIAPVFKELAAHADRLAAELDKINPTAWVEKGASETYAQQLQSCKVQTKALADGAKALAGNPEQLAAGIELLLRMQSIETIAGSIQEGMRKYQSPSDAQSLAALVAEAGTNRDRFQRYIVALAADRERQLQIMDKEAQRCRAMLTAPVPAVSKSGKKK